MCDERASAWLPGCLAAYLHSCLAGCLSTRLRVRLYKHADTYTHDGLRVPMHAYHVQVHHTDHGHGP